MSRHLFSGLAVSACLLAGALTAYGQGTGGATKIAIINKWDAVTRTQEGQKRLAQLQEQYRPKGDALEKRTIEIQTLREQLTKGSNTMSDEAQRGLIREIQQKERDLQRDNEDLETDYRNQQQEILNEIYGKVKGVIQKLARDQGYSLVLDVSAPETPVVDAFNELDITSAVIELYDKQYPQQAAAAGSPAAAKPTQ
jgi:outer membrane protein